MAFVVPLTLPACQRLNVHAIMKTILIFRIFAACVGLACVALLHAQEPPLRAQPDKNQTQWAESCLKDFESIKTGMTRAEVEAKLAMDGGLQSVSPVRYAHPACGYFKMDVEFEFKRNAADQNRAVADKADKVTKLSKPYIERPSID